jgi:hypothetical protein
MVVLLLTELVNMFTQYGKAAIQATGKFACIKLKTIKQNLTSPA